MTTTKKRSFHTDGCNGKGTCQFCRMAAEAEAKEIARLASTQTKPITVSMTMTVTPVDGMTPAILAHAIQLALDEAGITVTSMEAK